MMGIEGDAALPAPVDVDPASLPTAKRLPTSLKQAIEALFRDAGGFAATGVCSLIKASRHGLWMQHSPA